MIRPSRSYRRSIHVLTAALAFAASASSAQAQAVQQAARAADPAGKKALSVDDYTRWRSIDGAQMSADGKWVAYGLRLTNTPATEAKPVLYIVRLEDSHEVTIPNASAATFSSDSRWVTYQVEAPATRGGRGGRGGVPTDTTAVVSDTTNGRGRGATPPPPARRTELRELATGKVQSWQDMQSATFSPTSSHLLLRRRGGGPVAAGGGRAGGPPGGGGGGAPGGGAPQGAASSTPRGADAILHDLSTGRGLHLGSVGDASFNRMGSSLAYTVDAAPRDGNGLFVIDLKTGSTQIIDNDARAYNRLSWNDEGTAIAVLKGREVPRMRERDNMLVVFPNVRAADPKPATLDPSAVPKGFVISDRAPLSWSDDNKRVFLGIMPQTLAPDTSRRANADSVADVDIWRTQDDRIQSQQMIRADAERNFAFREAFDVAAGKFIALSDSSMRDVEISADGRWAVGRDTRAFISDYERPRADVYRVNTSTGERTLMLKAQLLAGAAGISPNGQHYIFWNENKYQSYDLDAGVSRTIGATAPSFIDTDFDHPGPKPPFGVAGYTADGKSVVVEHKYDLWALPLNGTDPARNLTNGAGTRGEIKFNYVRTEPVDPMAPRAAREGRVIDLAKPVTLSAYGEWTKKSGFYELSGGSLKEIIYEDASFSTPVRAAKADRFLLTRQTFAEFPDLRVAGVGFKDSKKISNANPQQAEFLWGHRVLFDYKIKDGRKLQGILALPDDYKAGEKRPMIVSFYEKNSQNMHRYSSPSFVTGMGSLPMEAVTKGYVTMLADVYFHTGSSHSDMLDAVEAATKKVIELGYADPKKIAVHGHSYGGEGAAFIGTRSRLFAAVGMGAGVTDLYTDFNQSWGWSYQVTGGSGANGNDYYLYGQGRWGFSPWEKPEVYHFESALTHVPEVTAPFLMMHGTADPTVSFTEGMNFYNALRYNKKEAVMLAYPGEGHGLRGLANRRDLTVRYFEFFDHYLKGTPAPKWMTDGVPYLVKNAAPATAPRIVP